MRYAQNLGASVLLAFAAILSPAVAKAGCGSFNPGQMIHLSPAAHDIQAQSGAQPDEPWHSDGREAIVGMWKVQFTATDGSDFADFGYSQWHSDGTELLNSGSRAPATQNYCLGVWAKTGDATYKLNHFALSYDQMTGVLDGKVNIREEVKINANRNAFSGTFTIAVYDPAGATVVHQVQGDVTGTRVTVNTPTP